MTRKYNRLLAKKGRRHKRRSSLIRKDFNQFKKVKWRYRLCCCFF